MKRKLKRFWKEWGFSKEDLQIIASGIGLVATIASMYVLMCAIG